MGRTPEYPTFPSQEIKLLPNPTERPLPFSLMPLIMEIKLEKNHPHPLEVDAHFTKIYKRVAENPWHPLQRLVHQWSRGNQDGKNLPLAPPLQECALWYSGGLTIQLVGKGLPETIFPGFVAQDVMPYVLAVDPQVVEVCSLPPPSLSPLVMVPKTGLSPEAAKSLQNLVSKFVEAARVIREPLNVSPFGQWRGRQSIISLPFESWFLALRNYSPALTHLHHPSIQFKMDNGDWRETLQIPFLFSVEEGEAQQFSTLGKFIKALEEALRRKFMAQVVETYHAAQKLSDELLKESPVHHSQLPTLNELLRLAHLTWVATLAGAYTELAIKVSEYLMQVPVPST